MAHLGHHSFLLKRGSSFEIGRPGSTSWKNFGHRWTREVGDLENWTIFMDVICVSSLSKIVSCNFVVQVITNLVLIFSFITRLFE